MRTYARLIILCAALCVALSACAPLVEDEDAQACDVCATFYPLYALCAPLVEGIEDSLRLTCLTDPQDGCLRDYALSERDVYMLLQADLVVAGGRGLESFASTLQSLGDQGPAVVFTLLNIELYNQDDESEVTEESGHLVGANPHLYMSAQGAKFIVESAAMSMAMLFPACAEQLAQNMDATDARLDELYEQMRRIAACANAERAILLNEALVYTAEDLGIEIAGQWDRESGESVYGNEIDGFLEALSEMDARVVLIEKQAPAALIEILEGAGYVVARVDVLSTGRPDMGADVYFTAQLANAEAIAQAFTEAGGES